MRSDIWQCSGACTSRFALLCQYQDVTIDLWSIGGTIQLEDDDSRNDPPPSEWLGRTPPKRRSVRTQLFYGTRFGSNLRRKAANPSKPKPRRETVELESGLHTAVGKLEIWTEPAIRNAENVASWKHESDFVPTPVVRNTRSTVCTSCVPMLVQIVTH